MRHLAKSLSELMRFTLSEITSRFGILSMICRSYSSLPHRFRFFMLPRLSDFVLLNTSSSVSTFPFPLIRFEYNHTHTPTHPHPQTHTHTQTAAQVDIRDRQGKGREGELGEFGWGMGWCWGLGLPPTVLANHTCRLNIFRTCLTAFLSFHRLDPHQILPQA